MHFKKLASNAASLAVIAISLGAAGCATSTATKPVPREGGWLKRHEGFVAEAKQGGADVLFLGDSITDGWRSKGKEIWQREFEPLKAINFGISGDRTQHVLWRLRNGEANGIKPKAVVLMIGTNNTGKEKDGSPRNTTQEIISGVRSVVKELRNDFPDAKILLLAVFPRGDKDSDQRKQVAEVNKSIMKLHDGNHVHYLDIGAKFLDADGNLPADIMPDKLHPNAKGYEIWAAAIKQPLAMLLK